MQYNVYKAFIIRLALRVFTSKGTWHNQELKFTKSQMSLVQKGSSSLDPLTEMMLVM